MFNSNETIRKHKQNMRVNIEEFLKRIETEYNRITRLLNVNRSFCRVTDKPTGHLDTIYNFSSS